MAAYELRREGHRIPTRPAADGSAAPAAGASTGTGVARGHREAVVGPGRLHRPRCRHPHGHSQDPTGVGRLARVAAIRRDRRRERAIALSRPSRSCLSRLPRRRLALAAAPEHLPEPASPQPAGRAHELRRTPEGAPRVARSARVIAAAVADGRRRGRQDAAGGAARVRPRERIPRRRVAGRSGAALGARSGGADDRHRPWCPRGPAAIGARRPARHAARS